MKQRLLSLLLVCVLVAGLIPALPSHAATQSPNSPYAMIEYGYSSSVTCGTVRYISQVASDSYFYSSYWPSSNFGYYVGASVECGTASMSMALSYIGVNKPPMIFWWPTMAPPCSATAGAAAPTNLWEPPL